MKNIIKCLVLFVMCFSFPVHADSKGKVLVVMSNAEKVKLKEGKTAPVGFFLNEFAIPVQALMDAGYEIVVVTPEGKKPVMDLDSNDPMFFDNDKKKRDEALKLADRVLNKKSINNLKMVANGNLDQYVAIFVPGGHAPIVDLMVDPNLGKILKHFHEKAKPTAMICHGPAAVLSTLQDPAKFRTLLAAGDQEAAKKLTSNWIYNGYKMTILSNDEEKDAEKNKLKGNLEFYVEDAIKVAGANVENKGVKENNVVEDRELITGQNPSSDHDLGKTLVKAIDKSTKK